MNTLIVKLGLALAIGLLVGLERGWRERNAPDGSRTAGIRTYGISGLLGGVVAALAVAMESSLLFPLNFLGFAAAFGWFRWQEAVRDQDFSVTGVVAALAVFALGGLAVAGDHVAAAAAAAALAAVLASRERLHGLLQTLSWIELRSALVLAVMTVVVLPLLPVGAIDPWGALDLREIWIFTLLAATLSYLGYIAVRLLGSARGLLYGCLAGALVSSTAMTLALARSQGNGRRLAGAASLAAMVSLIRVQLIVAVILPAALTVTALPSLTAALTFGLSGWLMLRGMKDEEMPENPSRNPMATGPLVLFALIFAVVSIVSTVSSRLFGTASLSVTAAVSAMVDADAAALSVLRLSSQGADHAAIGSAVLAALASNAAVRLLGAATAGPRNFSMPLAAVNLVAAAAATAVFLLVPQLPWPLVG